jgi:hypothetical protein
MLASMLRSETVPRKQQTIVSPPSAQPSTHLASWPGPHSTQLCVRPHRARAVPRPSSCPAGSHLPQPLPQPPSEAASPLSAAAASAAAGGRCSGSPSLAPEGFAGAAALWALPPAGGVAGVAGRFPLASSICATSSSSSSLAPPWSSYTTQHQHSILSAVSTQNMGSRRCPGRCASLRGRSASRHAKSAAGAENPGVGGSGEACALHAAQAGLASPTLGPTPCSPGAWRGRTLQPGVELQLAAVGVAGQYTHTVDQHQRGHHDLEGRSSGRGAPLGSVAAPQARPSAPPASGRRAGGGGGGGALPGAAAPPWASGPARCPCRRRRGAGPPTTAAGCTARRKRRPEGASGTARDNR